MSRLARTGASALVILAGLACLASAASAEFGSIRLVSVGAAQQADRAIEPTLSADGRYVAFAGTVGPLTGIFRKDLATGAIMPVVTGPASDPVSVVRSKPSISADGRYVAFTTSTRLDEADDTEPGYTDVYVADLAGAVPTYELASALDGCDPDALVPSAPCGLSYEGSTANGSMASGRVALSADGRSVAFVTTAPSNLTSEPGGSTESVPTPAGQVAVRDLDAATTTLVSVERDPGSGAMTELPVAGGAFILLSTLLELRGAALSADGTTVAWLGAHLPAQLPLTEAEATKFEQLDAGPYPYDEPLWRRIAEGPAAPIRRVVAGDGTLYPFPALTAKSIESINGTQGWLGPQNINGVPQLSADGRTVALIGNPTEATNVFVVDMTAGMSRAQAVHQLTQEIVVNPDKPEENINIGQYIPLNGHVYDLSISADGQSVALATARQRFPLSPPNLVGSPLPSLGLVELFVIDRQAETIERVTHGYGGIGEPSLGGGSAEGGQGARSPSFAGDLLTFASRASNLVEGDGNDDNDVFLVESSDVRPLSGVSELPPGPKPIKERRPWRLSVAAFSRPDGSVRLVATVPAAGRLRAGVRGEVPGNRRDRKLATAGTKAKASGAVPIELTLPRGLRSLARTRAGLYATAKVSFRRAGRKPLSTQLQVRFHVHSQKRGGK